MPYFLWNIQEWDKTIKGAEAIFTSHERRHLLTCSCHCNSLTLVTAELSMIWGLAAAKRKAEGKSSGGKKIKKPKTEPTVETKQEGDSFASAVDGQDPLSKSWTVSFMKFILHMFLTCSQEWDDEDDEPYGEEPQPS